MAAAALRVAFVDSGCAPRHQSCVAAAAAFVLDDRGVRRIEAAPDALGHGSRVADILLHCAPRIDLLVAQVFRERLGTTPLQVAAAIDWAVECGAGLINLSLGLREPRPVLAAACARARAAGVVLCAAAPARGPAVYPAGFAGVLRVTGDARCAPSEIAALGAEHADFGSHVRPLDGTLSGAGASMACAWLSGLAARHLAAAGRADQLHAWLRAQARHHGADNPGSRTHEQ